MQQGWSHEVSVVRQERCGAGAAELSDRGVSAPIAISRSYKDEETSPMNLQGVSGTNQAGLEAGAGMATQAATLRWCQFVVCTRCIQCSRGQGADGAVPALVLGVRRAPAALRYRLQRSLVEGIIIERSYTHKTLCAIATPFRGPGSITSSRRRRRGGRPVAHGTDLLARSGDVGDDAA